MMTSVGGSRRAGSYLTWLWDQIDTAAALRELHKLNCRDQSISLRAGTGEIDHEHSHDV
jgi:hypothetical protein